MEDNTIPAQNQESYLRAKRNKILGVLFLIFSVPSVLKIYQTLNAPIDELYYGRLFDLAVAVPMVVLTFLLFKQKNVVKYFLALVLIGTIGASAFDILERQWLLIFAEITLGVYVFYYLLSKPTLKNYKISNYILLPLSFLIAFSAIIPIVIQDQNNITLIQKEDAKFKAIHSELTESLQSLISEEDTQKLPVLYKRTGMINDMRLAAIDELENALVSYQNDQSIYSRDLKGLDSTMNLLAKHREQSVLIREFVEYNEGKTEMTEERVQRNTEYLNKIAAMDTEIMLASEGTIQF